jgi:hypothetical protein
LEICAAPNLECRSDHSAAPEVVHNTQVAGDGTLNQVKDTLLIATEVTGICLEDEFVSGIEDFDIEVGVSFDKDSVFVLLKGNASITKLLLEMVDG